MKKLKPEILLKILAFMLAFSLPVNDQLSTVLMLIMAAYLIFLIFYDKSIDWKTYFGKSKYLIIIPFLLLLIRLISVFNPVIAVPEWDYVIRATPLLIIPFIGVTMVAFENSRKLERFILYGLLCGTLFLFLICEGNVVYQMILNSEPFEYFFRWRHLNIQYTEIVGVHPPYLGAIVSILIIWIFSNRPRFYKLIIVLLVYFLFKLLARNAIMFLLIAWFTYSIMRRQFKYLILAGIILLLGYVLIQYHPSKYLKSKVETAFVFTKSQNRFVRLQASWNTFLENPLIGAGKIKSQERRRNFYSLMEDKRAFEQDLNSHNQFMEYLSNYGILGFLLFITVVIYFLRLTSKSKKYGVYRLFLWALLFAFLTESFLERSLGIKFFSMVLALIIMKTMELNQWGYGEKGEIKIDRIN